MRGSSIRLTQHRVRDRARRRERLASETAEEIYVL